MGLDRGLRLMVVITVPVYLMLMFILVLDNYDNGTEDKMRHFRRRRGTGQAAFSKASPQSPSFQTHDEDKSPSYLLRKLQGISRYQSERGEDFNPGEDLEPKINAIDDNAEKDITLRENSILKMEHIVEDDQGVEEPEGEQGDFDDSNNLSYEDYENNDDDYWTTDQYKNKDYVRHFLFTDLFDPKYMLENANLCANNSRAMVFINSRTNNELARTAIRQTYIQQLVKSNISYAFIVSNPGDGMSMKALEKENKLHGDLIIVGCQESYFNLTLKIGHIFHWSRKNCPTSTYITKVDDDVYVNVPKLLQILVSSKNSTILGKVCSSCVPFTGEPYPLEEALILFANIVTRRHMPLTRYPPFAMGPAYVITNDITGWLLEAANLLPYFSYEDVFWTGLVTEVINQESGISFDSSDQKSTENFFNNEDDFSIKSKYSSLKKLGPSVSIVREDIPHWRLDRKMVESLADKTQDSPSSVIVHGIRWDKDEQMIEVLQRNHESISKDEGKDLSEILFSKRH